MRKGFFILSCCMTSFIWGMENTKDFPYKALLTMQERTPPIQSIRAAFMVTAYEKNSEVIEWLKNNRGNYESLFSFRISHVCQTSSWTFSNDYFFQATSMLAYGYTQD